MKKDIDNAENRITDKLRSQTGASITFALLLFLVCAALSAVVLVAATTTAGRIKNIAESDQRYYAVMSAAELVNDLLDDQTISTVVLNGSGTYSFAKPMNQISEDDIKKIDSVNTGIAADNVDGDDTVIGINEDMINTDAVQPKTPSDQAAGFAKVITDLYNSEAASGEHSLQFAKTGGSAITSMDVTISETFDRNAHSVRLVISPGKDTDKSTNAMVLVYSVEKDEDKSPPVTKVREDDESSPLREVTSSYETTWHLVSMKTGFDDKGDI